MSTTQILIFAVIFAVLIPVAITLYGVLNKANAQDSTSDPKLESTYKTQVKLLSDTYNPVASSKRPVTDLIAKNIISEVEASFVNFFSLGSRYTGYIGPFEEGYWDPDLAVQLAVNAGCRTFVLEIDYLDECRGETISYFPRIVVRDAQGKMRIKYNSNRPICNSPAHSIS